MDDSDGLRFSRGGGGEMTREGAYSEPSSGTRGAGMSTCITCMLFCTNITSPPEDSGTPSSNAAVTNELLHERGRGDALFACRLPFVDSPDDEAEDDVSTLELLPYGSSECRLLAGESMLDWGSRAPRNSKKENVRERSANTDCERRRDSRRRDSLAPGRSVVATVVGISLDGLSWNPKEAPFRSWNAGGFSPN